MNAQRIPVFLLSATVCLAAGAGAPLGKRATDGVYFGGCGNTNTHWIGYRVSVAGNTITWTAYTLDPAKRGQIKIAPAKFSPGTNGWTVIFDEGVFRGHPEASALTKHTLQIKATNDRQVVRVQDGKDIFYLRMLSKADLHAIERGRIPNPQSGANGRQPIQADTN